jgi:hypothetical protein
MGRFQNPFLALSGGAMTLCCGYPAISFPSVTQVLPTAIFRAIWHKRKTRYLIETAGFILVAGARFELTTFRL